LLALLFVAAVQEMLSAVGDIRGRGKAGIPSTPFRV